MFENLTDGQIHIVYQMFEEWCDKDRHGELESEYGMTPADLDEFSNMFGAITIEARKRRIIH